MIKIKGKLPGKNTKRIVRLDHKYIATGTKVLQVACVEAKGMWFTDPDGNTLLDFSNGMIAITGHCHPEVVNAIKEQLNKFIYFNGPDYYYEIQARLAKRLTQIAPGKFPKKVFFCNSGTESVEAAWKIVRWSTKRPLAIAFVGAFHGRTMGSLSLTGSKTVHKGRFFPTTPGAVHFPYGYCYRCAYKMEYPKCNIWCAKIIDEVYFKSILPPEEVGAIFLEPIQGEGGYIVPPKEFVQEIKRIADKYGILLVSDEVQSGMGRTGKMFAIEHFEVIPDIITIAKAMGSGIPIGATIFNAKYDFKVSGAHSNTFGGNPVASAATLATIDVIYKEKLLQNAKKVGEYFKNKLLELQRKYEIIGDVRGIGLMLAIEIVKDRNTKEPAKEIRDKLLNAIYQKGLLLLPCGTSTIRFVPAIIVKEKEIDIAVDILDSAFKEILK
jgi:4-aminobutyrate aminotransferase